MKHRSVIAFVIVAAALFAAPQLSHDLQSLRNALGLRLHGELLQAFLNLHTEEGVPAAVAAPRGRAQTLVASCTLEKTEAPAAKSRKGAPRAAAAPRAVYTVADALATRPRLSVESEVAMIIPPDSGIEPLSRSELRASGAKVREGAARKREVAEGLRHVAYVAAQFDAGAEWRKAGEEAMRELNGPLPGVFEFRAGPEGGKTKVLKVIKRNVEAPRPAPRAPRVPGQVACAATAPEAQSPNAAE